MPVATAGRIVQHSYSHNDHRKDPERTVGNYSDFVDTHSGNCIVAGTVAAVVGTVVLAAAVVTIALADTAAPGHIVFVAVVH